MYLLENNTEKQSNKNRNKLFVVIGIVTILLIVSGVHFASRAGNEGDIQPEHNDYLYCEPEDATQPINGEEMSEDYDDYIIPRYTEETPRMRNYRIERERREFAESITREQIIEDFDYMMAVLEENFPFFDLTYRRHGVDIREEARRFRGVLADESMPIDARIFEHFLFVDFVNAIHWVGHLRPLTTRYEYITSMYWAVEYPDTHWSIIVNERFTAHPSTSLFYGEFNESDFIAAGEQHQIDMHDADNFTMEVIEEGHIAYIRVNRLFGDQSIHMTTLSDFYNKIADFNHLIIDIRDNTGSWPNAFHNLITVPHLRRPVQLDFVTFYKGGEHNLRFLDTLFDPRFNDAVERPSHFYGESFIIKDEEVIGRDGRPLLFGTRYLAWGDLEAFDYYNIGFYYTLNPSGPDDLQSEFNGQKWLLTDWMSGSGSEHLVALYKQENLAIIVGEQGSGIFMCPLFFSNYFALPNTGIIIRYDVGYPVCRFTGHPLEEGILPHFFNRFSMDALQTTLELIAEGAYEGTR